MSCFVAMFVPPIIRKVTKIRDVSVALMLVVMVSCLVVSYRIASSMGMQGMAPVCRRAHDSAFVSLSASQVLTLSAAIDSDVFGLTSLGNEGWVSSSPPQSDQCQV